MEKLFEPSLITTKLLDLGKFIELVQSIENFWFTIVTLPTIKLK